MKTDKIAINTGNYYEIFQYKYPINVGGYKSKGRGETDREITEGINDESARVASSRARNKLRRLVLGNMWGHEERMKFITLTFKENITDLDQAHYQFHLFHKRLNTKFKKSIEYIAVHERQKRGAIHYHLLTFNLPYIEHADLYSMWGNRAEVKQVNKTLGTVGYLTKYLHKSFSDPTMKNRKRYFQTVKHQPLKLHDPVIVNSLQSSFAARGISPVTEYQLPTALSFDGRTLQEITKTEYVER